MLTVVRSNRAELLAQLLAQQLRLAPPDPFETVQVVVNTWPTSRWLGEQLALHLGGIAANIRFPFPASHFRRLVAQLLGDDPAAGDPWQASDLVWPLLEALPALVAEPEAAPLQGWLERRGHGGTLDLPLWQLGRAIADAFDDLTLYRPAMAAAWWEGHDHDGRGGPLPPPLRWQPLLFRWLRQRLGVPPFGLRVLGAIRRLREGSAETAGLTGPLRLFGLSSAAPLQVQLLQAVAAVVPVDLFLLTPCPDLWQRCGERRRRHGSAADAAAGFLVDWLEEAHGLEARFGRLGGEFQQLLEGTGEAQLSQERTSDLFLLPATAARQAGRAPSLLEQLQEQLVDPEGAPAPVRADGDPSLEFHPCPGRLRQVQIVRDRLLQLMAADPTLEPRHILVMTPEVDRFAPLVASVFGDAAATGVSLPWRLTDRSQQSESGIAAALGQLLRLGGERLTASALELLLTNAPLGEHFQLEPEDPGALTAALQACGFRWGLDAHDRSGLATHSFAWAIDRLLLGLVLPDRPGLAVGETAPQAMGGTIERQGRWIHVLHTLRRWLGSLRHSRRAADWAAELPALLGDLFGDGGTWAWELQTILAALADWGETAGSCPLRIAAPVVAAALEERLAADSGRFGHRSGALTISALEPMRAIPHRVIVLMGLDAGVFPRQPPRPGFHPLERGRELGDPDRAGQDRYALMEALISARDHLLLCWTSREEHKGEALPPAAPVRQWLELLQAQLGEAAAAALVVEHAPNPLDRHNFLPRQGRPPASCDRRLGEALRRLESDPRGSEASLLPLALQPVPEAHPAPQAGSGAADDPYDDLRQWLIAPQRRWLEQLGLKPREWAEAVEDLEPLELQELQRSALLRDQLRRMEAGEAQPGPDWLALGRGRGQLPPWTAGELEARALQQRWDSLHRELTRLGEQRRERHGWASLQAELGWRGNSVVLTHTSKPRAVHRLELWLQLLLAVAAGASPSQAVLIARKDGVFAVVERLGPPTAASAQAALEQLLEWRGSHHLRCWPVPPATGWAYAEAEARKPGSGPAKAIAQWEGGGNQPGEREEAAMALCFGAACAGSALLEDRFGPFTELAPALVWPLLTLQRPA